MNKFPYENRRGRVKYLEGKKIYGMFVFPGSKGRKSERNVSVDQGSEPAELNKCTIFVSSSNIAMAAKTLQRIDQDWVVQTPVASNLIVKVGDARFHLHKLPLVSRSRYLSKKIFQIGDRVSSMKLDNVPGGAKIFELVVKFCYGWKIDLTSSNIAPLYCAANFLEMSDDVEKGNLLSRTEAFLSFLIFSSWRDTFRILKSCESISFWAKELQVLQRCSESIALKASTDLKDYQSEEDNSNLSECNKEVDCWWFEDVSCLRIDHFIEVIQCMKSKGMKPNLVGSSIAQWTAKWLSEITSELDNPKSMKHQLQRVTIECLIRVLPTQENSVTCNFLLHLLKAGLMMQTSSVQLEALQQRIASLLELCRVPDLLVKNYRDDESVYDVGIVARVVETYVSCISSNLMIKPKLLAVGRLVDGYLMLVAKDQNLKPKSFQSLLEVLPKDARYCDDNVYRATDMYIKEHPSLTEEERVNLCTFLEYHRLSKEARDHVMKNNRLPLKFSTNFILHEQVNTASLKAAFGSNCQKPNTRAIVKANSKRLGNAWMSSQKEIKKMIKEVEAVKLQLNDLQKCNLKLLRKLRR